MERQNGYYWVLFYNTWNIAKWANNKWYVYGKECTFSDFGFHEIDESRIIEPKHV